MNHKERFHAIFNYEPADRMPVYFFGTWAETKERWKSEGLDFECATGRSLGPQVPEMDPDWENGMWDVHGLVRNHPIAPEPSRTVEDGPDYTITRTGLGALIKRPKSGSSISQHLEEALKPTREDWNRFKTYLNPNDPARYAQDWQQKAAALSREDRVLPFLGGSLFGWMRDWMGLEQISLLPYDDPVLYEEMIDYISDFFITLYRPLFEHMTFDFAYFFEDCCCRTGPLFSPDTYKQFYAKYYRKMADFYHSMGVRHILLDSDGKVDPLIPHWLNSGIDIIFPIEVGVWEADPVALRNEFGRDLKMFGGVDKHVITKGRKEIEAHLQRLKPLVDEGGYIPIPDHRIPPSCSIREFREYLEIYKRIF